MKVIYIYKVIYIIIYMVNHAVMRALKCHTFGSYLVWKYKSLLSKLKYSVTLPLRCF